VLSSWFSRLPVIYPGIGQELAPGRLPPGCCGVFGPDPSTTRDKGLRHAQTGRESKRSAKWCQASQRRIRTSTMESAVTANAA
jgi:hypothetical protein